MEFLKIQGRQIPDTYRDTILACYEFVGDIVLKVAPLVKNKNELIHQYLKVNWQNIVTVMQKTDIVLDYVNALEKIIKKEMTK
ncbi:MAG: hypothetical protein N2738_05715 [Thermodesulfovibrionales bacterium]|nr:hypothetical protein [Thermodesulfovibrionales bacterium]